MGKVVIPKNSASLEEVMGAMQIYYDANDWVSNSDFIKIYKDRIGVIGDDRDSSAYTKKTEIGAYYGFIEWEDIKRAQSPRRITPRGRLFVEHYNEKNQEALHEDIMRSLEEVMFGRNNYACHTCNSDIEPPALFLRAVIDLGYLTNTEFAFLVYNMENQGQHYTDTIQQIRNIRNDKRRIELPQEATKFSDPKPILILERWGVLSSYHEGEKRTSISRLFFEKYKQRLKNLKIYNVDMTMSETEQQGSPEDVLKHNLYGIHIMKKNDALSEVNPHVCIGWSILGDLSEIDNREALGIRYDKFISKESRGRGKDIGQIWRFKHDVKVGDYIILAENSTCHIGRIESEYYYDELETPNEDPDYKNKRKVTWIKKDIPRSSLSSAFHGSLTTRMSIWGLNDYKSSVVELLKGTYTKDIIDDYGEVIETEGVRMITFESNLKCDLPRNRIWFGAPGTGKSHTLNKEVNKLIADCSAEFERVTFHPDYSYAQFVGTYKPVPTDGDKITYDYVPGPFMRVLKKALINANDQNATPRPFILVIEEINRANVAAVFGDVFQLLDRDNNNCSEYEIESSEDIKKHLSKELKMPGSAVEKLKLPNNMFIWATMNSADQGVFPMDTAFKRRWDFTYLGIDNDDEKIAGKTVTLGKGNNKRVVEWNELRKAINNVLSSKEYKINEDKLMGPFFLSTKVIPLEGQIDEKTFVEAFKSKVIMYLFEDAAKQKKHTLFKGCKDTTRYSSIRDEFDEKGIFIFCDEVHNKFPAQSQDGEAE